MSLKRRRGGHFYGKWGNGSKDKNLIVAAAWEGYSFERMPLSWWRAVRSDVILCSRKIRIRNPCWHGPEITREIPNVEHKDLDEMGVSVSVHFAEVRKATSL